MTFLDKNNCNFNSYKLTHKFAFIAFLPFCLNQKQESIFQEVGGLVTKIFLFFCLEQVGHFFKAMPNSIALYIGIFLHVVPVRL